MRRRLRTTRGSPTANATWRSRPPLSQSDGQSDGQIDGEINGQIAANATSRSCPPPL
ncbi:hypothetical protein T484DRAFT_3037721 [Baffinella frigidus]|nr:hypothetical protein T484DRAFT_3037721 [Cryptophyta sp. CCMP2293]